jgi:FemAB-related protein (PEP-CTERM system-associated)
MLFYISAIWLGYVYVGYSMALAILVLRKGVRPLTAGDTLPSVAVLIAAHNEERDIGWKVAETLAWDYPEEKLKILVASDASEDATDQIIQTSADPRLTFIRMEHRGGKVRALNRLGEIASSDLLFFTDANAHIPPHALRLMVRHFADPRVGCVTGNSRSIAQDEAQATAGTVDLYRRYESMLRRLESRLGSVLVCDGAIFCMRSSLFQRLRPDFANDLETPMRVAAQDYFVTYEPRAVVFERDSSSPLDEFKRQRRMCAQGMAAMLNLRGVFGGIRGWQFVSHKLMRWLSVIPMAGLLASSAMLVRDSGFFATILVAQVIFYGMAAVGLVQAARGRPVARPFSLPFYVMLGLVAAQRARRACGPAIRCVGNSCVVTRRRRGWFSRRRGATVVNPASIREIVSAGLKVELATQADPWDRYVEAAAPDTIYHRWAWRRIIEESFGHHAFYLAASEDGKIKGVLPLVRIRSRLFGNSLVSVPFSSYGGVLADTSDVRDALLKRAAQLGRELGARHIELRQGRAHALPWTCASTKVTMEIDLPATAQDYWKGLSSGMRNKIRQAQKHNLRIEWGGAEALPVFYDIFAVNMRNLGTPVYPRKFFEKQICHMPGRIRIVTIWDATKPVAAGFLTAHHTTLELPWSASLPESRKKYSHVLMYWAFIQKAIEEGFRQIDLGRCSPTSGTHEFKRHWNPIERTLHWYYWLAPGATIPELRADNPTFKLATRVWGHLPLAVANGLGPRLTRSIP